MLLFTLCLACSLIGLVVISSATATYETSQYVIIQFVALLIGIFLFVIFTVIDIDILADKWAIIFTLCIILLILLQLFGVGDETTGNKSWIRFLGIGIQPSEIIKVAFIILISKHITYLKESNRLNHILGITQLVAHFAVFFGLIVLISADLGSALVYFVIFFVTLFFSNLKAYWFVIGAAAIAAVIPFAYTYLLKPYQIERIKAPYDASIDPLGEEIKYQANQSKIALASGRLTGTGLYNGPQTQSTALPEKQNDFIFAVIGEELGMIGCLVVMALLLAIIIRCVYIGLHSKNTLSMLVCMGVAASFVAQTFGNIGMCLGITPVIGITLPFFSYGGSSTFALYAAVGLVSGVKFRPKAAQFRKFDFK